MAKPRYFTAVREIVDENSNPKTKRTLLVLGEWTAEKDNKFLEFVKDGAEMTVKCPITKFVLRLAKSICHPEDEFDMEYGIKKCMKRLKKGESIGKLSTEEYTMLTSDNCQMIVDHKADHIASHIERYLPKSKVLDVTAQ